MAGSIHILFANLGSDYLNFPSLIGVQVSSLRNLVEHSYSQANLEVVAKDMFTEMGVSDYLAGDMFNKRGVSGDVYTCPLVMSDSCNINPIGKNNFFLACLYCSHNIKNDMILNPQGFPI